MGTKIRKIRHYWRFNGEFDFNQLTHNTKEGIIQKEQALSKPEQIRIELDTEIFSGIYN